MAHLNFKQGARKIGAALLMSASMASCAQAGVTSVLRDELAKQPGLGKVVREFPAPGGLTGIVLEVQGGAKMIAYLTPDGRYLISGAVIDLMDNANLTQQAAIRYIGKEAVPNPKDSAKVALQVTQMQSIVFGNAQAADSIAIVFNPSTKEGRELMMSMMASASKMAESALQTQMAVRFYPYGPLAPQLLAGSNIDRLHNLLALFQGKPLPASTSSTVLFGQRNDHVADGLAIKPPLMLVDMPQKQLVRAVHIGAAALVSPEISALMSLQQGGVQALSKKP
jgi:thiol:disulfide interchange protein DsbG